MISYRDTDECKILCDIECCFDVIKNETSVLENPGKFSESVFETTAYANNNSSLYGINGWNIIPFFQQSDPYIEFLKKHRFIPTNENPSDKEFYNYISIIETIYEKIFPNTKAIIDQFMQENRSQITNIVIFRLAKDSIVPVHTNYDPHIYRAHMGLIVPDGDTGIKVGGEIKRWVEGEFLIFDPMLPHTVWNFTEHSRYVLNVDYFRPDQNRKDVLSVWKNLVGLRMKESKLTFGLSGGRSDMSYESKLKYASEHELKHLLMGEG